MTPDVVVIGGGLHGCSAAVHLASRGCRVTVVERRAVGRHASGSNAGGVRTLGRSVADLPLALAAMELWRTMPDWLDDDGGFVECGQIRIAETPAEYEQLADRQRVLATQGFDHETLIGQNELYARLPELRPGCAGATVVDSDGAADPSRTVRAFRKKAIGLGVVFREDEAVGDVRRRGNIWRISTGQDALEAPVVVNAAGAWADDIAAMVGDHIPITTRCSMMLVTERAPPVLKPVVGAVGRKLSLKQAANGTLLIGGGQQGRPDRAAESYQLDVAGLARAADSVISLFPQLGGLSLTRCWAGLEAQTPDFEPVIGPSPGAPGFCHVFGFSGHGFQLAPIVGSIVADLVLDGRSSHPIGPFAPTRFASSEAA